MDNVFFHIDVNSAFLSWSALEKLDNGDTTDLRDIPAIIGGDRKSRHGVVLAKSIPAKIYQIQTGEPIINALRKCPNLTIEPPNMHMYEEKSFLLMDYLSSICPDIEQVSIDECYMYYNPISACFSSPVDAAHFIKDSIAKKFGFTVNIGISDKKVLAKMASDFKKPDLVHTLYTSEIKNKMWKLPVSTLYMCGKSSMETLKKLGITVSHQRSMRVPTDNCHEIFQTACLLFDEMWNGTPIRLLGVRTSKLVSKDEPIQMDLFSEFFEKEHKKTYGVYPNSSRDKRHKLDVALDEIKEKYGNNAVVRGSFLPSSKKPPKIT